ncbi:hypothetical protein B0H11DRAFT_1941770 [Mycena galericulata]|nr:hypothetical protein B0H11DRAFT_1941770 [Mycena galericulata]
MSPKSMVQVFGWFGNLLTNSSVAGVQLSPAIFTNIPNPEPNTIRTGPVHFSNTPTGLYSSGIHKVDVALYGSHMFSPVHKDPGISEQRTGHGFRFRSGSSSGSAQNRTVATGDYSDKRENAGRVGLRVWLCVQSGKDSGSSARGYYGPEWAPGPGPPLWTIQVAAMPDNSLTYKGTLFGKWGRYIQQIPPRGTVDENKMTRNKIFRVSGDIDARATW